MRIWMRCLVCRTTDRTLGIRGVFATELNRVVGFASVFVMGNAVFPGFR